MISREEIKSRMHRPEQERLERLEEDAYERDPEMFPSWQEMGWDQEDLTLLTTDVVKILSAGTKYTVLSGQQYFEEYKQEIDEVEVEIIERYVTGTICFSGLNGEEPDLEESYFTVEKPDGLTEYIYATDNGMLVTGSGSDPIWLYHSEN